MNNTQTINIINVTELLKYKNYWNIMPECILEYNRKNKIILDIPTNEVVSERQKHPVLKIMKDTTEIKKYIMSSLNKLSNDNLDFVHSEITKNKDILTHEGLNELSSIIITKVGTDKAFTQTYANLCLKLSNIHIKQNDENNKNEIFVTHLISKKCKELFDNFIDNKDVSKDTETINIEKAIIINHIKFIGHLYNLKFLKVSAINYCIDKLFQNILIVNNVTELLILLIKTIFDKYIISDLENMKKYFDQLKIVKENCKSFREKFMIQDLLEKCIL